jgi:hypothetical protein
LGFRSKRGFQTAFRAAGDTETTQDCFELDEGDPGFQLPTDEKLLQLFFFLQDYPYYKFSMY